MGFYNILETFFFISLAITFVLIMMLVYHFKGRISILEQKCDTMFEIMNNMVKEMKNIKYVFGMAFNQSHSSSSEHFHQPFQKYSSNLDNIQEENEEEESDEYDDENVNKYLDKIVVSDNEEDEDEDEDEDNDETSVKIINIDLNDENNEIVDLDTEELDVEQNEDIELEKDDVEDLADIESDINEKNDFSEIIVNKLDITINPTNENGEYLAKNEPMDYKKIDVSYLRTLAITRGLVSDTKRLKKNDLVRLLEQSDEN